MRTRPAVAALALVLLAGHTGDRVRAGRPESGTVVKEFTVTARRFAFEPALIEVDQGDHVKITVATADGTHGFAIGKLDIREPVRRGQEPVVIEFDATEAGTFEISCSEYCGVGHNRMKGSLVVRPR